MEKQDYIYVDCSDCETVVCVVSQSTYNEMGDWTLCDTCYSEDKYLAQLEKTKVIVSKSPQPYSALSSSSSQTPEKNES